jgi:hypothetical protein
MHSISVKNHMTLLLISVRCFKRVLEQHDLADQFTVVITRHAHTAQPSIINFESIVYRALLWTTEVRLHLESYSVSCKLPHYHGLGLDT